MKARDGVYVGVIAGCFAVGLTAGWWEPVGGRLDHYAYDEMSRSARGDSRETESVVVAIDERTLESQGGVRNMRPILTKALAEIVAAQPKAVAIDVILHDATDPKDDAELESALKQVPALILPCELVDGKWEDPLARFIPAAQALGHVQRDVDPRDGVSRQLPLEQSAEGKRRWALALEAFRTARVVRIVESPDDLEIGAERVPAPLGGGDRPMLIRYVSGGIPLVSVMDLAQHADQLRGKTVFVGVTALSAARDRLVSPAGQNVAGVAVHAHAYETLARGEFIREPSDTSVLLVAVGFAAAAGLVFAFLSGWAAYGAAAVLLVISVALPWQMFRHGVAFPFFVPVAVAWLCSAGAAIYQHFFVRRQLSDTESEKTRYQRAIHWAAHEMRTPLTAIQGSSEIMTRYKLGEDKQKQLTEMIHSESKRLSRIIQTFLDVERLAEGQMELKKDSFAAADLVDTCLGRVRPIAERKQISITLADEVNGTLTGDRELMEYAFYNLLTNAVKYSPAATHVTVTSALKGEELRLAVADQGMGMDAKELKSIFQKFYRTKKAEASGEVGTGIGLSIVDQIIKYHGGRIDVTSEPGKGSCFTMVLKASASE
jgi:signal transduction histidine kinase